MTRAYAVPNWWWSAQEIVNLMTIILSKMFLTKAELIDSHIFVIFKLKKITYVCEKKLISQGFKANSAKKK